MAEEKTNVMRILEQKKATFSSHDYTHAATTNGEEVARVLGQDPNRVFKTLVTQGASKQYHVFMVPVCRELHLKKASFKMRTVFCKCRFAGDHHLLKSQYTEATIKQPLTE